MISLFRYCDEENFPVDGIRTPLTAFAQKAAHRCHMLTRHLLNSPKHFPTDELLNLYFLFLFIHLTFLPEHKRRRFN
jgi:hypothetical protein